MPLLLSKMSRTCATFAQLRRRDDGIWGYTEPDWAELKHVVTGHGPKTEERLAFRRGFLEQEQWVRDVVLAA